MDLLLRESESNQFEIVRVWYKNNRCKVVFKVGCVLPIVTVSILPQADFRPNDPNLMNGPNLRVQQTLCGCDRKMILLRASRTFGVNSFTCTAFLAWWDSIFSIPTPSSAKTGFISNFLSFTYHTVWVTPYELYDDSLSSLGFKEYFKLNRL